VIQQRTEKQGVYRCEALTPAALQDLSCSRAGPVRSLAYVKGQAIRARSILRKGKRKKNGGVRKKKMKERERGCSLPGEASAGEQKLLNKGEASFSSSIKKKRKEARKKRLRHGVVRN